MKLYNIRESPKNRLKRRKATGWRRDSMKRFYSQLDMSIIKHDISIRNSQVKRGDLKLKSHTEGICQCGCGAVGCFVHYSS
jgi:hypothetical protein